MLVSWSSASSPSVWAVCRPSGTSPKVSATFRSCFASSRRRAGSSAASSSSSVAGVFSVSAMTPLWCRCGMTAAHVCYRYLTAKESRINTTAQRSGPPNSGHYASSPKDQEPYLSIARQRNAEGGRNAWPPPCGHLREYDDDSNHPNRRPPHPRGRPPAHPNRAASGETEENIPALHLTAAVYWLLCRPVGRLPRQ